MFNKNNITNLMQQAKKMQDKMTKVQGEIADMEIVGNSGAGLVKIVLNGNYHCRGLTIDESLIKDEDKEVLEDLIIAAFNDAVRRISILQKEKMKSVSVNMSEIL